jgi:hypothetical protein
LKGRQQKMAESEEQKKQKKKKGKTYGDPVVLLSE